MKEKGTNTILSVAGAALFLLSISACGTTLRRNPPLTAFQTDCSGSACFADVSDHVALLSADIHRTRAEDYLAKCGEIQNCRAITVITLPLDYADTATVPHTSSHELSDSEK
jgi:hypothetical protein